MLYSQLQEGLSLSLVRSSSVSGCMTYKELCVAANREEKRLADLRRRERHHQSSKGTPKSVDAKSKPQEQGKGQSNPKSTDSRRHSVKPKTCHNCGSPDHFIKDCKAPSKESAGWHEFSLRQGL